MADQFDALTINRPLNLATGDKIEVAEYIISKITQQYDCDRRVLEFVKVDHTEYVCLKANEDEKSHYHYWDNGDCWIYYNLFGIEEFDVKVFDYLDGDRCVILELWYQGEQVQTLVNSDFKKNYNWWRR